MFLNVKLEITLEAELENDKLILQEAIPKSQTFSVCLLWVQ